MNLAQKYRNDCLAEARKCAVEAKKSRRRWSCMAATGTLLSIGLFVDSALWDKQGNWLMGIFIGLFGLIIWFLAGLSWINRDHHPKQHMQAREEFLDFAKKWETYL